MPEALPEKFSITETETILQVIPDPLMKWDGSSIYPLLQVMDVDNQGQLTFPPHTQLDNVQVQQ